MLRMLGSAGQCRHAVTTSTPPARFIQSSHNARRTPEDALRPASTWAGSAAPRYVCFSAAAVDAEAADEVVQDRTDLAESTAQLRRPRKNVQGNRKSARGKDGARSKARNSNNADRALEVHLGSSIKACAYVATMHLRKHGSMRASAEVKDALAPLVKVLALAQRVMLAEDKCIAMLNMAPREDGSMAVDLALAGAQPVCVGTELKIKGHFSVDTTARIIVAKVATSEPCFLVAAGQEAVEVAVRAVAKAQARLATLGFRIAVVPSYQKGPDHPMVMSGGFEPVAAPTPAAGSSDAAQDGASADGASGGLPRSSPENSAVGAVALSVVLVEEGGTPPPPAPSPEPAWVRRGAEMTALAASDLEVGAQGGAASTVDDAEAASAGTVMLEVTQRVEYMVLADQIVAELRQKGSVNLSVDTNACGSSLRALHAAGRAFQAPTRLLCDLAPSSRDGSYILHVTTASSLPTPTPAPTPPPPRHPHPHRRRRPRRRPRGPGAPGRPAGGGRQHAREDLRGAAAAPAGGRHGGGAVRARAGRAGGVCQPGGGAGPAADRGGARPGVHRRAVPDHRAGQDDRPGQDDGGEPAAGGDLASVECCEAWEEWLVRGRLLLAAVGPGRSGWLGSGSGEATAGCCGCSGTVAACSGWCPMVAAREILMMEGQPCWWGLGHAVVAALEGAVGIGARAMLWLQHTKAQLQLGGGAAGRKCSTREAGGGARWAGCWQKVQKRKLLLLAA